MSTSRRLLFGWFTASLSLLLVKPVLATTWTVEPTGPGAIAQTILQAAPGDTIALSPGQYSENELDVGDGRGLILIGTGGADATRIVGQGGRIIRGSGDLVLEGITLSNGVGAPGGALYWEGGTARIERCRWEDNDAGNEVGSIGGSAAFRRIASVVVRECVFRGARAVTAGHLYVQGDAARIENTRFEIDSDDAATGGGAAIGALCHEVVLEGVTVISSEWIFALSSVLICAEVTEVRHSRFIGAAGAGAAALDLRNDCFEGVTTTVRFEDNLIVGPAPPSEERPPVEIGTVGGDLTFARNTSSRVRVGLTANGGSMLVQANILDGGRLDWLTFEEARITCNDWYESPVEGVGSAVQENNIALDPQFCDRASGDYRIATSSPCAAQNAPDGCGRLGALPEGCGVEPVLRMSWGGVKTKFR